MKKFRILYTLLIAATLASCDPREDREDMPAPIAASQIKFAVTQQAGYDNKVMLENQTAGVLAYWDYGIGISNKQKDTIILPFAGTYNIKFYAYSKGGPVKDSASVTVSSNDANYFANPMWNQLTNGQTGKVWVWAIDEPNGACYGNGSGGALTPEWWRVGVPDLTSWGVVNDEMTFDLNGAANFTKVSKGKTEKGFFALDTLNKTLKITGSDISNGKGIVYNIVKINNNELTVVEQGDGWRNLWLFKRKGFNY
ncbi:hypothetical protein [uncultured Chitinophaga sp.]|uniref:hypothetical protein n=1 Tax=uncultured Chitinophaga sp. TaxID=339340 RepID=UPI0025EDFC70|nr:hypothetical protein [uncultured Chitinophaga sp.]